jgi:hypothetical protein
LQLRRIYFKICNFCSINNTINEVLNSKIKQTKLHLSAVAGTLLSVPTVILVLTQKHVHRQYIADLQADEFQILVPARLKYQQLTLFLS